MKAAVPQQRAASTTAGRRRCLLAGGWALAAGCGVALAGCGTSPPTQFYDLRLDAPEDAPAPPAGMAEDVWELAPSVALPSALDRDTLQVASGAAGLEPLVGHRWAAPLRDTVPRLLLHDLQRLRGPGRVWLAPVPPGVQPTQRLRVELLQLLASADRRTLQLQAQWWWLAVAAAPALSVASPAPAPAPRPARVTRVTLQLPLGDASVDTLAAGHRLLLWRLALQVAASAAPLAP